MPVPMGAGRGLLKRLIYSSRRSSNGTKPVSYLSDTPHKGNVFGPLNPSVPVQSPMVRDRGRETGTEEFDMRRFRRPLPAPLTIPIDLVEKLVLQNPRLFFSKKVDQDEALASMVTVQRKIANNQDS